MGTVSKGLINLIIIEFSSNSLNAKSTINTISNLKTISLIILSIIYFYLPRMIAILLQKLHSLTLPLRIY